jgi:hypothetical protein
MTKEFKINDILDAVSAFSKLEKKNSKFMETKKDYLDKSANLDVKHQAKSNKSEILVLDQMIE